MRRLLLCPIILLALACEQSNLISPVAPNPLTPQLNSLPDCDAYVVSVSERPLYVAAGDQLDPRISGDRLVFTDYTQGAGDIILVTDVTLNPAPTTNVTNSSVTELLNDIDGDYVVYTRLSVGHSEVVMRNVTTSAVTVVTGLTDDQLPRISGSVVVYEQFRASLDIYAYDFAAGGGFPVATGAGDEVDPAISGQRVVYVDEGVVTLFDFSGSPAPPVTTIIGPGVQPDIDGDYIVYAATDPSCAGCGQDVMLYDIAAGLSSTNPINITAWAGNQRDPTVLGNYVGYEDDSSGDIDIWVYFIAQDLTQQITDDVADQFLQDVGDGHIAYTDNRNGDLDIYISDFELVCRLDPGRIAVLKTTEGVVNLAKDWTFSLYAGPDGFGGTPIATDRTLNVPDGLLEFGREELSSLETFTLCETGVPAGWTSLWKIDADGDGFAEETIIPYNPNEDDDPPKDLGNRCFDIGAGTSYAIPRGGVLNWEVDNDYPGGDPRSTGFWKNWNTCTAGNQSATAAKNGGLDEGWFILDDILNDPGVVWGNHDIRACEDGVNILDRTDIRTEKKRANDAAYALASQLLAAQVNLAAGAESCQAALDASLASESLLVELEFDATGRYLLPKDSEYASARALMATLDEYNNGHLCTP